MIITLALISFVWVVLGVAVLIGYAVAQSVIRDQWEAKCNAPHPWELDPDD